VCLLKDQPVAAIKSRYGKRGTGKRTEFEIKAKAFLIGEVVKDQRQMAKLTREQLQLSTLYRLLEFGLRKKVELTVR
jgi:hypothetical protein